MMGICVAWQRMDTFWGCLAISRWPRSLQCAGMFWFFFPFNCRSPKGSSASTRRMSNLHVSVESRLESKRGVGAGCCLGCWFFVWLGFVYLKLFVGQATKWRQRQRQQQWRRWFYFFLVFCFDVARVSQSILWQRHTLIVKLHVAVVVAILTSLKGRQPQCRYLCACGFCFVAFRNIWKGFSMLGPFLLPLPSFSHWFKTCAKNGIFQ